MKQKHFNLTGGLEEMEVIYKPNCKADDFATRLFIESERDILLGTTTVGPHRDDMQFFINGSKGLRFAGTKKNFGFVAEDGGNRNCRENNRRKANSFIG